MSTQPNALTNSNPFAALLQDAVKQVLANVQPTTTATPAMVDGKFVVRGAAAPKERTDRRNHAMTVTIANDAETGLPVTLSPCIPFTDEGGKTVDWGFCLSIPTGKNTSDGQPIYDQFWHKKTTWQNDGQVRTWKLLAAFAEHVGKAIDQHYTFVSK